MVNKKVKIIASIMSMALIFGCCSMGIKSYAHDFFKKQECCHPEDNEDMSVKEMKKHLKSHGYSQDDMELLYLCGKIETMQKKGKLKDKEELSDKDIKKLVEDVDEQASVLEEDDGSTGGVPEVAVMAYEMWNALTDDEKALVVAHPVKALAVNATSNKATELTIMAFGVNGLGDKSDGYRHAMWNCLMTREIGKEYAEEFANAHESGKTEEELAELAADGFEESLHQEMDLHNNEVGRNTIDENEPIETYDDKYLYYRIMEKMTNNKVEGEIYWLHD